MPVPKLNTLTVEAPFEPYDTETMTHAVKVRLPSGGYRTERRVVFGTYGQAVKNRGDYYHKGGNLIGTDGSVTGYRKQKGWFLSGYKWADDPDYIRTVPFDHADYDEAPDHVEEA